MKQVAMGKYRFKQVIKQVYNDPLLAALRELIQNSVDAEAENIWFEAKDGWLSCRDDGCGMNLAEFEEFYVNLGGTKKKDHSIGGFGAAKEITFAMDSWAIIGRDFICHGEGNMYRTDPFQFKPGLVVTYTDATLELRLIRSRLAAITKGSYLPAKIWFNNEEMPRGRKLKKNQLLHDFRFARLYYAKKPDYGQYHESSGMHYVRTGGLLTHSFWIGGDFTFYTEVDDPVEVMGQSREQFKEQYSKQMKIEIDAINKKGINGKEPVKNLTLYGVPLSYKTSVLPAAPNQFVENLPVAAEIDGYSAPHIIYDSDAGEWPAQDSWGDHPIEFIEMPDIPLLSESPDEEPEDGFLHFIDTAAINDLEQVTTAAGILNFTHRQQQLWDYPFAVIEDGEKATGIFHKDGTLTPKARKALGIILTVTKMVADKMQINMPIPALMFSPTTQGINAETGPYEVVALRLDLLLGEDERGTPLGVLERIIHEMTHHYIKSHYEDFELKRVEICDLIGRDIFTWLVIIEQLQK